MFWMLFLSPLMGAILNGFILRANKKKLSHIVGCCCVGISFIISIFLFLKINISAEKIIWTPFMWISVGSFNIAFEIVIDQLSSNDFDYYRYRFSCSYLCRWIYE